jgi:hypothetical protein
MMLSRSLVIVAIGPMMLALVTAVTLQAQSRGSAPNRLDQVEQMSGVLGATTKAIPTQALAESAHSEGEYLVSSFWEGTPLVDSGIPCRWLTSWGVNDRQGDTRLKSTRLLAKWNPAHNGNGEDHYYLRFDLKRVVTSSSGFPVQGHLGDPLRFQMIKDGLLSENAHIKFQLKIFFDKPDYKPGPWDEVHLHTMMYDIVILDFNGNPLNVKIPGLRFGNSFGSFECTIPTSAVRFPIKGDAEPSPAWNVIHFKLVPPKVRTPKVYTFVAYPELGATMLGYNFALDAELSFGSMAPIFLVHGTNADPSTWNDPNGGSLAPSPNRSFNDYFSTFSGICFNDIALTPNGGINENGKDLKDRIKERLTSVGAKACHIIAHSKGGLDSRAMIYDHYKSCQNESLYLPGNFEVLSLYTLDTPHRGTVLSDIAWNALHQAQAVADPKWHDLEVLMAWDWAWLHNPPPGDSDGKAKLPTGRALEAQMTHNMDTWNRNHGVGFSWLNTGGRPLKFYNTASDADWFVRDVYIDTWELRFSSFDTLKLPLGLAPHLATSSYRMLYYAKEVKPHPAIHTEVVRDKEGNRWEIERPVTELFVPEGQGGREWNDTVVAISSAVYDGGILFCPVFISNLGGIMLKNHSSVKSAELADGIVEQIRVDWPLSSR